MSTPLSVSPSLLTAAPTAPEGKTRAQIGKTAKEFESAFVSIMLAQMFEGVGENEMSGGQGGTMFRSFLMDSFAKQISRSGGIGISSQPVTMRPPSLSFVLIARSFTASRAASQAWS